MKAFVWTAVPRPAAYLGKLADAGRRAALRHPIPRWLGRSNNGRAVRAPVSRTPEAARGLLETEGLTACYNSGYSEVARAADWQRGN
jgi:hypothetical protein